MSFDDLAQKVIEAATARGVMIVTAESCTGGMVSATLTAIPGSSAVLDRGFVTYSNESKMELLGVSAETLDKHGAVSDQTAREMLAGALKNSRAQVGISITGIAGPGGGTPDKPVGLVYLACGSPGKIDVTVNNFKGDRAAVRRQSELKALELLLRNLSAV